MNRSLHNIRIVTLALLLAGLSACTTTSGPREDPYALYRDLMPKSILVLPPINESIDVNATYSWLTTATMPIAEQGYYVFPVAVVDEFMKENGLPNPEDMHTAPLDKIGEIFGADAVLYVTIQDYGQKFRLISSETVVDVRAELIDVKTGQSLWANSYRHEDSSNSNSSGGGLLGAVISAAVAQVGETLTDAAHDASRVSNSILFRSRSAGRAQRGLLLGERHPGYAEQVAAAQARAAELEAAAAQAVPLDE